MSSHLHYNTVEDGIPSPGSKEARELGCTCHPPDQKSNRGNKIARALGKLIEPYFMAALEAGGIQIGLPNKSHKCGEFMVAHPDIEIVDNALAEIKFISGFGYRKILESPIGVEGVEKGHHMQAQLYMHSANKEWLLYLASPSSHSTLQTTMRQRRNYSQDYELEPCYLEWVQKNEDVIQYGLDRAIMVTEDVQSDEPPPREHSGLKLRPNNTRNFPCGFCLWWGACNEIVLPRQKMGIKFVS